MNATARRHGSPQLSVVIPTYNYGRFLGRAIDSVLESAGPSDEILVVDDGSTDETPDVVRHYGRRIASLRQPNSGVAAARNAGIDRASGEYLVFLDADDRLLPGGLDALQQGILRHREAGLVFGRYVSRKVDGTRRASKPLPAMGTPLSNFRRFIGRRFSISNGTAAVRRDVFARIRYPVGITHAEDLVVFGQILALFQSVSLAAPIAEIIAHPQQARKSFARVLASGLAPVEALFRDDLLPPEAMRYRQQFESRWSAELAGAAFRSGEFATAEHYYRRAFALNWQTLLKPTHLARYVRSRRRAA